MALAPGIARKVKKVLETPVDSPEILSCLRSLSDFYPENTPAARRGLRRSVERHGLEINREYLVASNQAQEALRAVDGQLARLLDSCDRIGGALERTRERTGALLRETAELDAAIASVEEKKRIVATFAVDFQLTDEDVAALEGRPGDVGHADERADTSSASGALSDSFFDALDRARAIHGNCRALLQTRHQRAGLDLMDQMAAYQERAHERLCRWVQTECRALAEEDSAEDVSDALAKAMNALRRRPTLFRYCVEEVSRTRHNALFRRFIGALTRGGPGGVPRPIETHASDPKRYVGDMLGWLHQAAAGEKELVAALLSASASEREGENEGRLGSEARFRSLRRRRLSTRRRRARRTTRRTTVVSVRPRGGTRPHFGRRAAPVPRARGPGADREPARRRKRDDALRALLAPRLLRGVFAKLVGSASASLAVAAGECAAAARDAFEEAVARRGEKLKKNPPAVPDDLGAPACVAETAARVAALLDAEGEGAAEDGGDAGGGDRAEAVGAAVASMLDPALEACELAAASLDDVVPSGSGSGSGPAKLATMNASSNANRPIGASHPRWAREAFLANCFAAARTPLRRRRGAAVSAYREALERRADDAVAAMATTEAERLLERVGVREIAALVSLYREDGGRKRAMRDDPALSASAVGGALDALVDAVGAADDPAPSFDAVRDPKRRADARRAYAGAIIEAFTTAYAALLDPSNGYGDEPKRAMRHGPNALSTLLGGV
jgi:hypothetical protein